MKEVDRSVPLDFVSTPKSSPPHWLTPRNEQNPNLIPLLEVLYAEMGREIWWSSRMVLETQTELTAPLDEGGVPVYKENVASKPRQAGFTEGVIWPEEFVRGYLYFTGDEPMKATICHVAQNATATTRVIQSKIQRLLTSPEFQDIIVKPGAQNPHIFIKNPGSYIYVISSNPDAGRGLSPDFIVFDEFQSLKDTEKLQDMEASSIQQAHARILKVGTAGNYKSGPWNDLIAGMQEVTENGWNLERKSSFFNWSAEPLAKYYQEQDGQAARELDWYLMNDDRVLNFSSIH